MREWMTAEDLAALRLSKSDTKALGMRKWPESPQGINKRATMDGWEGRQIGSSQAWEYRLPALPALVQKAAARTLVKAAPVQLPAQLSLDLPDVGDLKNHQRNRMDARAALIGHIDHLVITSGLSQGKAVDALVAAAGAGELPPELQKLVPIANARSNGGRTLVRATVYNWLKARSNAAGNVVALAPKGVSEALIPSWASTYMDRFCRPSKPGMAECLARWPADVDKPSYDQVRRFLKRIDAITKNSGRMGPKALQQYKAYIARDVDKLWPGAVFIGDGHTFKAEVAHPFHGRPFRPEITVFLDVFTRRWVGWSIALAENTWSVADAVRHAITTTTCCDILYYDNGAGAKNTTWDDELVGLAARLNITKFHSAPWSSQARGVVERFNSSVLHELARHFPTYCGQRMDDEARRKVFQITRKDIKDVGTSKLLPAWQDLMGYLADTMEVYNDRPHSSLPTIVDAKTCKRRHMSPNEKWAMAVDGGWVSDPISEDEARDLFRPVERRIVQRGVVKLFNNDYFSDELTPLHGQEVAVGFDIHDANKVWVRLLDGRFVCEARWNANHRDYMPVAFVERAREKRVEGKLKRLDAHRDVALAELPSATIIQHQRAPESAPISAGEQSRLDAMEAEWTALPAPIAETTPAVTAEVVTIPVVHADVKKARFRRALDVEGRLVEGADVSDEDAAWLARYQALPEYRAAKSMYDDFGDEWLTA